jgi:hypothetical protein
VFCIGTDLRYRVAFPVDIVQSVSESTSPVYDEYGTQCVNPKTCYDLFLRLFMKCNNKVHCVAETAKHFRSDTQH